jgi:triacylglycerol lipase
MFPIVLAHGIARFDILREKIDERLNLPPTQLGDELQYFRNVRTFLNANGFPAVFNTDVDFAGPVERRAAELKQQIDDFLARTGAEKAHVIAHSMGGLDARLMIVDLGMAEKVASLTTIGTPHLGTVLADHVINQGGSLWIDFLQKAVRLNLDGFNDLTITACEAFNARARDAEAKNGVFYQTYASFEEGNDMFLPLFPSWAFIRGIEGRNDGLVPVRSQKWESELIASDGTRKPVAQNDFPLPADHLNQCGWWDLSEALNPFFGGSFAQQRINYELKIKNVYLAIAQNLQTIPNL